MKKCQWLGKTWADLTEAYCEAFSIEDATHLRRHHFCLRHKEFKVVYENWSLEDLYDGAMIEIRTPDSLARARHDNEQLIAWESQRTKRSTRTATSIQPMFDTRQYVINYMAKKYGRRKVMVHPLKYWRRKVWLFFDDSNSSLGAYLWAIFIIVVIMFSTVTFCVETLPYYNTNSDTKDDPFSIIEIVNVSIFTFEFVLRLLTVPNQKMFWSK